MRIVADENIPLVKECFGEFGELSLLPGREIRAKDIKTADALLIRSVTRVATEWLKGSKVQFVGSATIGTDHVDITGLQNAGIHFAYAPGCNAASVAQYVISALLHFSRTQCRELSGLTVGIVGAGNVGSCLARYLDALGVSYKLNDPPLQQQAEREGRQHQLVSLSECLACDVVTFHVPLTRTGSDATYHLLGRDAMAQLKPGALVINSSRGEVVDNAALLEALRGGRVHAVLDVWEREPDPPPELIAACALATPHIAGYSFDGKVGGTRQIQQAFCEHFELTAASAPAIEKTPLDISVFNLSEVLLQAYAINTDSAALKQAAQSAGPVAEAFDALRKNYRQSRRDYQGYRLHLGAPALAQKEQKPNVFRTLNELGFEVAHKGS